MHVEKAQCQARDLFSSAASKNVFQYQSRNYFTLLERLKSCHFSIRYSNNFPQFTASTLHRHWEGGEDKVKGLSTDLMLKHQTHLVIFVLTQTMIFFPLLDTLWRLSIFFYFFSLLIFYLVFCLGHCNVDLKLLEQHVFLLFFVTFF